MISLPLALVAALALSGAPASAKKTQLLLEVKPDTVVIYVDGKKKGTAAKVRKVTVKPGTHLIKLVNNKDQHQEPVTVKAGQSLTWKFEFEDDRPKSIRDTEQAASDDETSPLGAPDSATGGAGDGELTSDPDMVD